MSRRDSPADSACEAIADNGIGVGTGFAGLGFDVAMEGCWAPAMSPLKIQQEVINKTILITLCIVRALFEQLGD